MADASIKLVGVEELKKLLEDYPAKVTLTAQKRGLTRGAARLRTAFRHAMPRGKTGRLKKSIKYQTVKGSRGSKIIVGLTTNQFYRVLEDGRKPYKRKSRGNMIYKGSAPMRDTHFDAVWHSQRAGVAQLIIDETKRALFQEANKIHSRMLGITRRKF
jgi:hypothetical protein